LTAGDPAGIGPEIAEKAMRDATVRSRCDVRLYGPDFKTAATRFSPGVLSADAGRAAYDAIVAAVRDAMAGEVDAIATAPVSKEAFALAGFSWKGHTDLLAELTGAGHAVMMFYSERLSVSLATVHLPLADVPRALTPETLERTIRITAASLPMFGYTQARLAVAGLNPHAGERGVIGREDDEVIAPTVARCRRDGLDVSGPFPGDTVFVRAARGEFDAVVACYHDQGLIPVKLLSFGSAVNVTLGLPIVRTSVDHGTAFDIAGQDRADPRSLIEAVLLAGRLVRARNQARSGEFRR
jgi:4-hydroxythreonine-4-phosphate dehydrogenase